MPETFKTLLLRNCSLHSARRKVITTCPLLVRCKHDTSELFTFDSRKARNTSAAGRRTCGVKKAVNGRLGNAFSSGTGTVTLLTFFSETTAEKDGLTTGGVFSPTNNGDYIFVRRNTNICVMGRNIPSIRSTRGHPRRARAPRVGPRGNRLLHKKEFREGKPSKKTKKATNLFYN